MNGTRAARKPHQRLVCSVNDGQCGRPPWNQFAAEVGVNVLQPHRTQNAAAVADASGVSRGQAGAQDTPEASATAAAFWVRCGCRPWFSEYCGPAKPVSV